MSEPTRVALVTGAARRVGKAIALALARRGCDIALHYHRSDADARATAEEIMALGRRVSRLPADLTDAAAVAALPRRCREELGRLDVLVNNASTFPRMSLANFNVTAWNDTLAVNLTAPAILCHHAAPLLSPGGSIVNLCDITAERPMKEHLAYCAAKAGLVSLTRALARTLAPSIRVNGASPGIAVWPEDYDDDVKRKLIARVPALRAGTPEEVAAVVTFLALDATYVTGVILAVDGARSVAF